MPNASWKDPFAVLRKKWSEVPAGRDGRLSTQELLALPDAELLKLWTERRREATTGPGFSIRGWYHALYRDVLRGKRVLDVGSGFGMDALTFAEAGAHMTCLDIAPTNLEVLGRLAKLRKLDGVAFHYMEGLASLEALPE